MPYIKKPIILLYIGDRLRDVRKEKKMTQEDVAHKAGIAVSQVGRIERGKLNPSVSTMFVIALALEVEPKELFDFDEQFIKKKSDHKKKK